MSDSLPGIKPIEYIPDGTGYYAPGVVEWRVGSYISTPQLDEQLKAASQEGWTVYRILENAVVAYRYRLKTSKEG